MASSFFVPGPALVWVGTGAASALEFLGVTESGIRMSFAGLFEDVPVDYAGMMPGDVSMLGQEARISGIFPRYDEAVLAKISSFISGATPGAGAANSVGTLLMTEGGAYPLVIEAPYAVKTPYSGMTKWFNFTYAYVVDAIEYTISIRRKAPSLSWRAIPNFGSAPWNSYTLYTTTTPSPTPTAS